MDSKTTDFMRYQGEDLTSVVEVVKSVTLNIYQSRMADALGAELCKRCAEGTLNLTN